MNRTLERVCRMVIGIKEFKFPDPNYGKLQACIEWRKKQEEKAYEWLIDILERFIKAGEAEAKNLGSLKIETLTKLGYYDEANEQSDAAKDFQKELKPCLDNRYVNKREYLKVLELNEKLGNLKVANEERLGFETIIISLQIKYLNSLKANRNRWLREQEKKLKKKGNKEKKLEIRLKMNKHKIKVREILRTIDRLQRRKDRINPY